MECGIRKKKCSSGEFPTSFEWGDPAAGRSSDEEADQARGFLHGLGYVFTPASTLEALTQEVERLDEELWAEWVEPTFGPQFKLTSGGTVPWVVAPPSSRGDPALEESVLVSVGSEVTPTEELEVGEEPEGAVEEEREEENEEGDEEENEEESWESYELKDPAYLEALAAALAASKRSGLLDFGQQGLSSSGAGPSVVVVEVPSVSVRAPVSPTMPARVFWSGTLHLSVPSAKGKGYL